MEKLNRIQVTSSIDRISTDSNTGGLAMTSLSNLPNRFVSQGTRTGNNPHFSWLMDVTWHDTNLTLTWSNNARTVRTD